MADFFPELLDGFVSPDFMERVRIKYHYEEAQTPALLAVAEEMLPLIRREAFWERNRSALLGVAGNTLSDSAGIPPMDLSVDPSEKKLADMNDNNINYEDVVISLGAGIDALQDRYSSQGMLSRSYMLEVLASELLLQGYGAYNRYVEKNTDRHVARYHFLGSEDDFPLEELPRLLEKANGRLTCNEAFCMNPKKSAVFTAELTRDEKVRCESICVGCDRLHCPNRIADNHPNRRFMERMADLPMPYGYSRIFGKA